MSLEPAVWGTIACGVDLLAAGFTGRQVAQAVCGPGDSSSLRLLVLLLTVVGQLVVVQLLCGALVILYAPVAVAGNLGVAALVRWLVPAGRATSGPGPPGGRRGTFERVEAAAVEGVLAFAAALAVVLSARGVPTDPDDVTYHLPNAAYWARVHDIWHLPPALPGFYTNTYPSDGELLATWVIQAYHSAVLATLPTLLFGGLLVIACAALAEQLGGPASAGLLGATVILMAPADWQTQVHSVFTDWAGTAGLVAAATLGLRARSSGGLQWMALAGVAFGLGIGSKDSSVLPAAAVLVFVLVAIGRGRRLRSAGAIGPGLMLLGGIWFVRNWIDIGNPAYPESIRVAGETLAAGGASPMNALTWTLVGDALDPSRHTLVRSWVHLVRVLIGPAGLICLGLVVALALYRRRRVLAGCALTAIACAALYLATPSTGSRDVFLISSTLRYSFPALFLAAVCACVTRPWVRLLAWVGLGWDLFEIFKGANFNPDVHTGPLLLAVAVVVGVAVACCRLWASDLVGLVRLRWAGPPAGILVAVTLIVSAMRPLAADPVDQALRAADLAGPVLVIGDTDVLASLGPRLERPVEGIGTGVTGETPYTAVPALDRALARLGPAAVVVGPEGALGVIPGWSPPGFRLAAVVNGNRVFTRPVGSPPGGT